LLHPSPPQGNSVYCQSNRGGALSNSSCISLLDRLEVDSAPCVCLTAFAGGGFYSSDSSLVRFFGLFLRAMIYCLFSPAGLLLFSYFPNIMAACRFNLVLSFCLPLQYTVLSNVFPPSILHQVYPAAVPSEVDQVVPCVYFHFPRSPC
jgi:hypothetical protein